MRWVCVYTELSLVCSASKPEALQRVSERILNCDCERVRGARAWRLYLAALARTRVGQISIAKKVSNKAQDVVATYSQSNVRTISM